MKKVSVVIPCFHVEEFILPLFHNMQEVEKQLNSMNLALELVCVDDGSKDGTWDELLKHRHLIKDTQVVRLTRNFGAICASNAGLKLVTGDACTIYAADLQDPLELIPEMAQLWSNGEKYITAVRAKKRKDPLLTRIYAKLYYVLVKLFVMKDFPESGFDIAFWDGSILQYLKNTSKNINRSLFSHWLGFKPYVIEYERRERSSGKSGWTFSKKWKLFLDSFLGFSVVPIRFISFIGMCVSFFSFGYGILMLIGGITGKISEPGFATVTSLITFLLGLVIVMLGVIGEYLWRIFDEVNKRPESVIEEILRNE